MEFKMIFAYPVDYEDRIEIGKPIKMLDTLYDIEGNEVSVDQPVIALRHATFEEYVQYIKDSGATIMESTMRKNNGQYKFVEIGTD
jgi:hypothetical protein